MRSASTRTATLKRRKVATIALDYAFGWESVGGFERTFVAEGGTIAQKIWVPVSVHDFAPYLAQIPRDVDAVYALVLGRAALQFMRQYQEFGLKQRVLLIGGGTTTDEHVLPFMGDEALGVITALHYSAALETPANRKFVGRVPRALQEDAELLLREHVQRRQVVRRRGRGGARQRGGLGGVPATRFATVRVADLPRGPVQLDEYGSPIENIYIRKVERVNGELQNTVIETLPRRLAVLEIQSRASI